MVAVNDGPTGGNGVRDNARKMSFHANRILPSAEVVEGKNPAETLAKYKEREEELKKKLKMIIQRVTTERADLHKTIADHDARAEEDAARIDALEERIIYLSEMLASAPAAASISEREKAENAKVYNRMVKAEEELAEQRKTNMSLKKRVEFLEAQAEIHAAAEMMRASSLMVRREEDRPAKVVPASASIPVPTPSAAPAAASPPTSGFVRATPSSKPEPVVEATKANRNGVVFNKNRPTLMATTDYFPGPDAPDDLQFTEGDLLYLIHQISDGWLLVEDLSGRSGRIPYECVRDLEQCKRSEPMRVVADFGGEIPGDLLMRRDDVVCIIVDEDDWWVGELPDGSIGYIPSNFVRPI